MMEGDTRTAPMGASRGAKPAEVYGFVGWIVSTVAFVAYLAWAYVPEASLVREGIAYFPDKSWALAIPAGLCWAIASAYFAYDAVNRAMVPPLNSRTLVQDEYTTSTDHVAPWHGRDDAIPPLIDIPIRTVNAVLHLHQTPLQG
mmetsp:Transcript_7904/g.48852  ORF Transcript_7904/g.48852 Transcript_7904/m.48852 type:complete len:144 (+) Transcript_7904:172-603(+)